MHLLLVTGASAAQFVMIEQEVAWPVPKGSTNRHGGGARYELDLPAGANVSGCFIGGALIGLRNVVSPEDNVLSAPDPRFNEFYIPEALQYRNAGYRRSPDRPGPK